MNGSDWMGVIAIGLIIWLAGAFLVWTMLVAAKRGDRMREAALRNERRRIRIERRGRK